MNYKIVSIGEGKKIKLRLISMGLYVGVILKIIKNDKFGPLILSVKGSRISVGRGLAMKIIVERV
ncbi:MAG: hypothetical protein AMS24_03850 [Chlamydiae bacterium SM23_39]|nr:MAG: hypothetical protein AMS24_03850 [Chlamydiae bacterium SM23_39]